MSLGSFFGSTATAASSGAAVAGPQGAAAGASTAITLKQIGAIASLFTNSKDPERLARNASAYGVALGGNQQAANFLKYRGGGGTGTVGAMGDKDTPGTIGGWATRKAQDDAKTKWESLAGSGVIDAEGTVTGKVIGAGTTAVSTAGVSGGLPLWLLVVLAGGLGFAIYKTAKG